VTRPSHIQRSMLILVIVLIVAIVAFEALTLSQPSGRPSPVTITAVRTATVIQTVSVIQISTTGMTTTAFTMTEVTSGISTQTTTVGT